MQTTAMTRPDSGETVLRAVLTIDASFSGLAAVSMTFGCIQVDRLLGLGQPLIIAAIGLGLLPYAFMLWRYARADRFDRTAALVTAFLDLAWVAASLVVMAAIADRFTAPGLASVAAVGVVVLAFAGLKLFGLAKEAATI